MMRRHPLSLALLPLLALAQPLMAQDAPSPPSSPSTPASEGGLSGSVSDEADWQDLGIAIPGFATDADVPTQANAGSTAALGRSLAGVISANLRNNGLFKPSGPDGLPQPGYGQVRAPEFSTWSGAGAEMLVRKL